MPQGTRLGKATRLAALVSPPSRSRKPPQEVASMAAPSCRSGFLKWPGKATKCHPPLFGGAGGPLWPCKAAGGGCGQHLQVGECTPGGMPQDANQPPRPRITPAEEVQDCIMKQVLISRSHYLAGDGSNLCTLAFHFFHLHFPICILLMTWYLAGQSRSIFLQLWHAF